MAVVLALIASLALETLLSPQSRPDGPALVSHLLGRLITVRYALGALWIALVLARPALLQRIPIRFAALLDSGRPGGGLRAVGTAAAANPNLTNLGASARHRSRLHWAIGASWSRAFSLQM